MVDRKVCIVFASDFGDDLRHLDPTVPVWIVRSEKNNPVIADLWKAKVGNITSFQPEEIGQLLDTVDEHHPDWAEFEVHGLPADEAESALAKYGHGHFTLTPNGFVFRRKA